MTTLGDIIYGGASGAGTRLAGNTTANRRFLRQTGTGSASAAPAWDGLVSGDIPNNSAEAGSVANSLTFKADGTGAAATVTYNGSTARTISYNSIGAQPASVNLDSLAGLTYGSASAIVRMTAANTFTLDTGNYLALVSQTQNRFLASPNGSAGVPSFRAIVAADIPTLNQNTTGSAATLTTARTLTIGATGKTFDGSADRTWTLAEIGAIGNPMTTLGDIIYGGAAGAVTRLAGSTSSSKRFLTQTGDGTVSAAPAWGSIAAGDVPTLNQNTTGSAATLTTARTFTIGGTGKSFDGSANVSWTLAEVGALSNSSTSTQSGYFGDIYLYDDGTPSHYLQITNSANLTAARILSINVNDSNRTISLDGNLTVSAAATVSGTNTGDQTNISGNAGTATSLQTARTLTIGDTGKSFNGTANVSWSLAEIGAQAAGSYVTTNTYQSITGYKEFASYGSSNKTGFLCNNATTGFMFFQNVSTGKTWDWEILSNGTLNLNESGVSSRLMLYAGGGARVYGNMTADAFFEASDIRYKEVLHTNPVVDLSSIDVIKYRFTDDLSGQVRYGYSAQDIQAICADLVTEKDERLYLNYSDVHTLKIAALEKRVKELELKLGL